MNERFNEHRDISYLCLMQALAVAFGWVFVVIGVKVWTAAGFGAKAYAVFLRDWGGVLFLIPVAWLCLALALRRSDLFRSERQLVFWSGLGVAFGTFFYLLGVAATAKATSSLIQVVPS